MRMRAVVARRRFAEGARGPALRGDLQVNTRERSVVFGILHSWVEFSLSRSTDR
jgi:hypothetical protein